MQSRGPAHILAITYTPIATTMILMCEAGGTWPLRGGDDVERNRSTRVTAG
jgi:hypothetical protein